MTKSKKTKRERELETKRGQGPKTKEEKKLERKRGIEPAKGD